MKLVIASDHGGLQLKNQLVELLRKAEHEVQDLGTHTSESCDYPDFAHAVGKLVTAKSVDRGLLICGSGVGMSIAANRHAGVRAVVCTDTYSARLSREHNDANVLCLGEPAPRAAPREDRRELLEPLPCLPSQSGGQRGKGGMP
jgi:ribose 5-phosphate isomerase B